MRSWIDSLAKPVLVAGVGSGLTAAAAAAGGADALSVYSTAVYRIKGLPTALSFLPYEDCNAVAFAALRETRAALRDLVDTPPVFVGLGVHDPRSDITALLDSAIALGANGVSNEPFVSMYGSEIEFALERSGLGFEREVRLLTLARDRGLMTFGWAFNPRQAAVLADCGVDLIGAMAGISQVAAGSGDSLAQAIAALAAISDSAKARRRECLVLGHGGPFTSAESVRLLLAGSSLDGFATGSDIERDVVHAAVRDAVGSLKRHLS